MLIQKINPTGLDIPVQRFQSLIHTKLLAVWGIDSSQYKSYGVAIRNPTADGYTAENYEGLQGYKEVYYDDSLSAISFFGRTGQIRMDTGSMMQQIHLVFFVDLKKIKPTISHRADEEVRKDVLTAIGTGMYGFTPTSVELWIENVLREYPGSRRDDRLRYVDMDNRHCFRINFDFKYNINNC